MTAADIPSPVVPLGRRVAEAARIAALVLALALFLAPLAWLATTAYKPARDIFSIPPVLTFAPTFDNFRALFALYDVPRLVGNSLAIALGSTAIALVVGVPAGYALARSRWKHAITVAYVLLAVRMMPRVVTLMPFYLLMRDIGLLGSTWAVALTDGTLSAGFVVWMIFNYVRALPPEAEWAAQLDGRTAFGAFLFVAVPLIMPGIVASALFSIMLAWNDFLTPAFLTVADSKPISVALLSAYGTKDVTWGTMGAMAHFSTLPIVALALLLNRYFVQGLTKGMH
ncbi:carbohydrate ABC transporter permease [Oharaeibacter diazotrophicus]|uniref:Multiple sugar transport system permease protein n=1 Tax=Oharaeibacter diazotrophicus TaxID=1920512 RepID=A0A4R6RAM6_9HYPH|nr:carbohydrate ABC transporter permease [Oharaeibacter diazotrophicus]TDP83072.1 multiple sugar transport system permease protein [Oharaeibacter diazotrophicus]BBE71903.1 lactose transport system permease protein LacG [Pleomorphomonas sp. SM30]GLS78666.1 ABC transporter permease [Oharaeibacter diazotrophicus]